jgi:hypothetical protein
LKKDRWKEDAFPEKAPSPKPRSRAAFAPVIALSKIRGNEMQTRHLAPIYLFLMLALLPLREPSLAHPAPAVDDKPKVVRVRLDVSADSTQEAEEIEGYIEQSLSSLKNINVKVFKVDPDYIIKTVWIPIRDKEKTIVAHSVSVVLAIPVSEKIVASLNISKKDREKIINLHEQTIAKHFIIIGPNIKELCEEIVNQIASNLREEPK